ncbi:MAG: hypothetical protein ACRCWQ_13765 [Bacilli bacterium]
MRYMKHTPTGLYIHEIKLNYGYISEVKMHRVQNECVIYECNTDGTADHVINVSDAHFIELATELTCEAFEGVETVTWQTNGGERA